MAKVPRQSLNLSQILVCVIADGSNESLATVALYLALDPTVLGNRFIQSLLNIMLADVKGVKDPWALINR